MKKMHLLLAGILLLALVSCTQKPATEPSTQPMPEASEPSATQPTEILVSAAASLTDCMTELGAAYEAAHPGVKLTFNFGASGTLQQQIEQGAPTQVFVSAGKKQMTALTDQGLMEADTVHDLLENKVVLITPKTGAALADFEDLLGTNVEKIGVGEAESVPVGQYTAEIFDALGLTEPLQQAEKLVYAKDVREVLSWVETGNVQAGVVYETDAKISDRVSICCTAPAGSHQPVVYPAGVVKGGGQAARDFAAYLFTEDAGAWFVKYGFTPLEQEG